MKKTWMFWLVGLLIAVLLVLLWFREQKISRLRQKMEETIPAPAIHLNPKQPYDEEASHLFSYCADS